MSVRGWTSAFLLDFHRLCNAIEGRLSHFLQCWLKTGWQNVISQVKIPWKMPLYHIPANLSVEMCWLYLTGFLDYQRIMTHVVYKLVLYHNIWITECYKMIFPWQSEARYVHSPFLFYYFCLGNSQIPLTLTCMWQLKLGWKPRYI